MLNKHSTQQPKQLPKQVFKQPLNQTPKQPAEATVTA